MRQSPRIAAALVLAAAASAPVAADFTGFSVESVENDLPDVETIRVYANFDDPADELLNVGAIDVFNTEGAPFWQATFGGDTAPLAPLVQLFPETEWDTFVTAGVVVNDGSDVTALGADFAFNDSSIEGGWFNSQPAMGFGQGFPDPDGRVVIAQLSQEDGVGVTVVGQLSLEYLDGETGETVAVEGEFSGILTPTCPADLSGDLVVNGTDLAIMLAAWTTDGPGDLDGSGVVDVADLAIMLASWGPCFD